MHAFVTDFRRDDGERRDLEGVLPDEWRIESIQPQELPATGLAGAGLVLSPPPGHQGFTLWRTLVVPVEAEHQSLHVTIAVQSETRLELRSAVREVAIGRLTSDGRKSHLLRFSPIFLRQDGSEGLSVEATVPWPAGGGEHYVEFRFKAVDFSVARIEVGVVPVPVAALDALVQAEPPPGRSGVDRRRVAVVTWEVSDNPFGRAHLLADMIGRDHAVEIVGPAFARPRQGVWAPHADSPLPVRSCAGGAMREFLRAAQDLASSVRCDVVHASKTRFPGLLIALLVKHHRGCPVVLDIDDHEKAFFPPERAEPGNLERFLGGPVEDGDLDKPQGAFWTGVGEALAATFADRTVVNGRLSDHYGGLIVRHARDETVFRPNPGERRQVRRSAKLKDGDRVILFAGTPRRHKGLKRLLAALERLADPRLILIVVGTVHDRGFQRELEAFKGARVRFLPDRLFSDLPSVLQMADGVCLLQDPDSVVSEFQTPAKLTDALALGVPVAMTPVQGVADLTQPGLMTPILDDAGLDAWLLSVADSKDPQDYRRRRLDVFESEFGYGVNRARIERAHTRALERPAEWRDEWTQLFRALNLRFGANLPDRPPNWARGSAKTAAPAVHGPRRMDLVCFWKQNDTGIYGRRHDMLLKYLRQHEQVGTIIQFDAPMRIDRLREIERSGTDNAYHHGKLIADATSRRFLEIDDDPNLIRRTFVYARDKGSSYFGRRLPQAEEYRSYVADIVGRRRRGALVGWGWPIAPFHDEASEGVAFDLNVIDLIDDQRTMAKDEQRVAEADEAYRKTLGKADIVFANCAAVQEAFAPFSSEPINVVPNACEFYGGGGGRPRELDGVAGPLIGYVGNLRSRIDVDLLESVVAQRPSWSFVLVGSAHDTTDVLRLQRYSNVHMLGPKVYEDALIFMRCFDVAIMPHLKNAVSDRMNPLKLYVYVALGIPVVTTDVANIDDLADYIEVAGAAPEFIEKLDAAVARRAPDGVRLPPPPEELRPISWPKRVDDMLSLCARALAS